MQNVLEKKKRKEQLLQIKDREKLKKERNYENYIGAAKCQEGGGVSLNYIA